MVIAKHEPKDGIFIGNMPNEVLGVIFSGLPHNIGLVHVASVCKHFKALILPLLYRTLQIEAKWMKDKYYTSLKADELPPGLERQSLSLTLKKCPDLCGHVRTLDLKVHNVSWYNTPGGHQRLLDLLPLLKELSLNPPPKEYNFPMSERLTAMKLNCSYNYKRFWAPNMLINATPFDLDNYLSKPTLRKLEFEHVEPLFYKPVHTGSPGSSAVISLHFTDWHPEHVRILKSVLPSIRQLKHFMLETCGQWQIHLRRGPNHGLAPHDYGVLLQPHSASLEELIIAYSDEAYNDGRHFPKRSSPVMGTLVGYHNLKRLAIPEPFLVSAQDDSFHQMLPPQLEELQIQYPMGVRILVMDRHGDAAIEVSYRLTRMQRLARNKEASVPRLKHVVWWFQQTSQQVAMGDPPRDPYTPARWNATRMSDDPLSGPVYGPPKDMDDLAEDFRKVGIKFEWVSTPSYKDTPFVLYGARLEARKREQYLEWLRHSGPCII